MKQFNRQQDIVFSPILTIASFNFILLMVMLLVYYSFFATPAGYEIRMPTIAVRGVISEAAATIRISAENVLFLNDKVVTLNDLKRYLLRAGVVNGTIYVQADTRASLARVADIWEICKGLGIVQVKVSTF